MLDIATEIAGSEGKSAEMVCNAISLIGALCGNFDINLGHFSQGPQLYATMDAPCDVPYLVPVLSGC